MPISKNDFERAYKMVRIALEVHFERDIGKLVSNNKFNKEALLVKASEYIDVEAYFFELEGSELEDFEEAILEKIEEEVLPYFETMVTSLMEDYESYNKCPLRYHGMKQADFL